MRPINFGNYIPHSTLIHLHLYKNQKNEYNEYENLYDGNVYCNYQSRSQKVVGEGKILTDNFTTVLIFDNICPEFDVLNSGYIEYMGVKRNIRVGQKVRDIYGNFQFLQLELE